MIPKPTFTIRLGRRRREPAPAPRRRHSARPLMAMVAAAGLLFGLVAMTSPASADDVVGTVSLAPTSIRSVTVNPHAVDFHCDTPSGGLTFPNDICTAQDPTTLVNGLTVTNGEAQSNITVAATDFAAAGTTLANPPTWDLVNVSCIGGMLADGQSCSTNGPDPSTDQARLSYADGVNTRDITNLSHPLTVGGDGQGLFSSGGVANLTPVLMGPSSSTAPQTQWQTTITFTANPS